MSSQSYKPFFLWKHLNKLRWLSLSLVFSMIVIIPFLHVYQTYVASHAYDLLSSSEKQLYNIVYFFTSPFTNDPAVDLDVIKGNTWSGTFGDLKLSDPLAIAGHLAASSTIYWSFILSALIPVILTALLGRFFCGWICPATFIYELNSNFGSWLHWLGFRFSHKRLNKRFKYLVLGLGLLFCWLTGSVIVGAIYPPAILGREFYYAIALNGFGVGMVFFVITLLFDLLVSRRGFCRYLCPGGALYSLIGRYRLLRIKRVVENCNDCAKCNVVCEFGLDPLRDNFGQECNNCTACMAICPTDAMTFTIRPSDTPAQGPGHLGRAFRRSEQEE